MNNRNRFKKIVKILSGLLISGIAIFYFVNFGFTGVKGLFCASFCKNNAQQAEEEKKIPEDWLAKYDLTVSQKDDLYSDHDNDGLTLLEEYKYSTNPLKADTDGDGYNDGKEVRDGYNPTGEGKLDIDNDNLPDKWEEENRLNLQEDDYNADPDGDGLPNYLEYAHLTNPLEADTDGDGYNDLREIRNGYDPAAPGDVRPEFELVIEKINATAPIIWSETSVEEDMLEDLKNGVALFPKTGVPGQSGNAVISGHSSNYIWIKGKYNYIFRKLNNLVEGDKILIRITQKNSRIFEYNYVVTKKAVVLPDSDEIFLNDGQPALTLVTCWPLGTNWKRLMIRAVLEN